MASDEQGDPLSAKSIDVPTPAGSTARLEGTAALPALRKPPASESSRTSSTSTDSGDTSDSTSTQQPQEEQPQEQQPQEKQPQEQVGGDG